jgi:hypothetical protein
MVKIRAINQAYKRLAKSDVKYRFVIDTPWLKWQAPSGAAVAGIRRARVMQNRNNG